MKKARTLALPLALALLLATSVLAQDIHPAKENFKAPKKPYVEDHYPNRVSSETPTSIPPGPPTHPVDETIVAGKE